MKAILKFSIALLIALVTVSQAQNPAGTLRGRVVDEQGTPLAGTNILIKEQNTGCTTDSKGRYHIRLQPGTYTVRYSFIGYKTRTETLKVYPGSTTTKNIELESTAIEIGGITVVAKDDFIPLDAETKSEIHAGEIEHIQASSLNDIMELTPGVETSNPTLNTPEQLTIRGGESIGTQVVLDGVPVTNNANMQIGIGYSTANSGVDLRSIPAENVKQAQVIRGIPSVEYGDLTDGVMVVETRSSANPLRAKFKYNPHLYEFNISKGINWGGWILNGNINLALSEHDIRVEGDGYTRFASQFSLSRVWDNSDWKQSLYFTRAYDESKEKPGYALREAWYNRDVTLKYTSRFKHSFSSNHKINAKASVNYTHQNSFKQQLISRDNIVISDRTTEGTQPGRIVFGSYLGKKWIKGDVWNLYTDINTTLRHNTGHLLHTWLAGVTWRNDMNTGEGIIFDPLYPPSLTTPTPRLRTYDELPSYPILNLYIQDKITGRLFRPFSLQIGARYEMYRPKGINWDGLWTDTDLIESHNGSFFNPRINLSYNLFENTQIRMGYGRTSKSPPMGMLFAQEQYFDVVDTVAVVDPLDPSQNFSLITTSIQEKANPNLKGYYQEKSEISLDQQIGSLGFTVSAFRNDTYDKFNSTSIPFLLFKRSFPDWPDQSTATPSDTLMDTYTHYENNGWSRIRGVEFSLQTRRLPKIHTVLKVDAAYLHEESGMQDRLHFGSRRYSPELDKNVKPIYLSEESYSKNLLLNYRFDIQARPLGIWVTLHIQQKVMDIDGHRGLTDTLAVGYYDEFGQTVTIPADERTDPQYVRLWQHVEPYDLLEEDRPIKWLFNLKVSKALWRGAEVSFYVNNFFNHRPFYQRRAVPPGSLFYERRNPPIFYGVEFSTILGDVL